ncbi:putative Rho-related protein rac1A [Paratrimastix pyriformis]|uniref:Rho-related protein rac1A n=1 Tax=Paratrimastix pyriformis TaxID=342808 RepID=A0ABQ8UJ44_9EUKA|nr:putative Rho-related protein rac1A [Paratrimastix pyriformis]
MSSPAQGGVRDVKCVVVGDGAVGKTCMLVSYTSNNFPTEYLATVFDNYETLQVVDKTTVRLQLWSVPQPSKHSDDSHFLHIQFCALYPKGILLEEYDRLRSLSFPQTDVFLICFSVDSRQSLQNVKTKWYPEISGFAKGGKVPVMLVGTKTDIRPDKKDPNSSKFVYPEEAKQVVTSLGLTEFVECSARTQTGLANVFLRTITNVLTPSKKSEKSGGCCTIL